MASAVLFASAAWAADTIHVGVSLSMTGPGASLGIPERNAVALLPKQIGGANVEYTVLDDATDTTRAVANMRKLIEGGADVIVGSTVTPGSLAMVNVAGEQKIPVISLAASARLIEPMDAARHWAFKTPQNDSLMADAVADYMTAHGVKSIAFIGFNDAYGDGWLEETQRAMAAKSIKVTNVERFARTDTSVTGQVLKVMSSKPDAVLIAGAGTPAALPQKTLHERGYKGAIYQTHGVANLDFIRVGGKDVEGTILPAGPVLVASQLPDSAPSKKVGLAFIHDYEAANGAGSVSTFGAHAYDAGLILQYALPIALKSAKPGTPEFRSALRDAIEGAHELVVTQGVMDMSPTNHNGFDTRARVMVEIKDGGWKLLP
ncbi:ABC transporter substrate-binding protein [Acidisphaera sp. L21]|uniref:ABC transporter substrate-binding protein n=1 Tax=Acidisphaera sp. L21 TaxID=1641851 RepID=UPI0020B13ABF|nr:ABC transporter substrate-binding protein [Acidisphaera sp. L21]